MSLPTKEGYLFKYRNFPTKKWTYRYFKLNKTYLQYYEAQHSLNPKGNVVRTDITSVEASPALYDRDNVFTVCIKSNDRWQMSAANEQEVDDWIKVLRAHLPPSLASGTTKLSKEKLLASEGDPPSPTVEAPSIPDYMAAQLAADQPPSYADVCENKPPSKQSL